jgi:hypothetical protein
MTSSIQRSAEAEVAPIQTPTPAPRGDEPTDVPRSPLMKRADTFMLIGLALVGTWAFGLLGVPFLVYAYILLRRAARLGELSRPWSVTVIGAFCIVDVAVNYFGWGTDLLPSHDTDLITTLWTGYGRLFDGGYYINYNSTSMGGLAQPSEKLLEVICITVMYPMRLAAIWGFLQMKKWGLQMMIVTSWMYLSLWIGYFVPNVFTDYEMRFGASIHGAIGFWFVALPFASPFVLLPYLYTVDRSRFRDVR